MAQSAATLCARYSAPPPAVAAGPSTTARCWVDPRCGLRYSYVGVCGWMWSKVLLEYARASSGCVCCY
eukprot:scaffold970_cov412-Prasinococcus_capsulatus_cf.AAC.7